METISYKCPNCGGDLRFHPEKQDYLCEFCDSRFSQKELEAMTPQDGDEDADCYICPSCGAEIVTEPTTTATFCYYCHNPVVVSQRLKGTYHPDRIIPFAIDRKKALEIFGQWIGTKKYVPRDFYSSDQVEKLTGVYFPYWLYGCQVKASVDARGDKVSTWAAGNI